MMQSKRTVGIRLADDELAALRNVARREDRDVRRQAERLIRDGLRQLGELPDQQGTPSPDSMRSAPV